VIIQDVESTTDLLFVACRKAKEYLNRGIEALCHDVGNIPFNGTVTSIIAKQNKTNIFRIGELNPGLVGSDRLAMIESDKS
jgi:hypothetical protein